MRFLVAALLIALASVAHVSIADESAPVDASTAELIRQAISNLDHPDFGIREAASDALSKQGLGVIPALVEAAEHRSTEASVRAFGVLQRLYRGNDEAINEAVELAFQRLKRSEKLDVAARAVKAIESNAETRQKRAIPRFERLGGIIQYQDQDNERPAPARPPIAYIMLGRDWTGGDDGLRILTRIEEIRMHTTQLYIIRGINVAEETLLDLSAELPFLQIQRRGPAKLGVRNQQIRGRDGRCVIEKVDPGSAADRAGLRAFDQIIEIDGREIDSFEGLIEIIGEKEPGDRIPIVFLRDDQRQKVEAVLASWSKNSP